MNTEAYQAGLRLVDVAMREYGVSRELLNRITTARSFTELGSVAEDIIKGIEGPFVVAIGLMEDHAGPHQPSLDLFSRAYKWYTENVQPSLPIFYIPIFAMDIHRIRLNCYLGEDHLFVDHLCRHFFRVIMTHERLKTVLLLPKWHESHISVHAFNLLARRSSGLPETVDMSDHLSGVN